MLRDIDDAAADVFERRDAEPFYFELRGADDAAALMSCRRRHDAERH